MLTFGAMYSALWINEGESVNQVWKSAFHEQINNESVYCMVNAMIQFIVWQMLLNCEIFLFENRKRILFEI